MTFATMIDRVLERVQDAGGSGTSRADVLRILGLAQQQVNIETSTIKSSVTLTTVPRQAFYPMQGFINDCAKIKHVISDGRQLDEIPFASLVEFDLDWARKTSARPDVWAVVGKNILVIYPTTDSPQDIEVIYVTIPSITTSEDDDLVLGDAYVPMILDLAEQLLRLRSRQFAPKAP